MKRAYVLAIALLGWFAQALQLAIMISAMLNSIDDSVLRADGRIVAELPIQTNRRVALDFTVRLFAPASALGRFLLGAVVEAGILLAILFVGTIYVLVLQDLWNPQGGQYVADLILHNLTPLIYLGYWLLFVPHGGLKWQNAFVWPVYPLAYLVYALLRGAFSGFYAYPFIDVATRGYGRVLINALALLTAFVLAGLALVALDHMLGRLTARSGQPVVS